MLEIVISHNKPYVILGDFNIDLLQPKPKWTNLFKAYGLDQLINVPTRVTNSSKTLIDHIYVDLFTVVKEVSVIPIGISDHFPVCLNLNYNVKNITTNCHKQMYFRDMKNLNKIEFLNDPDFVLLDNIYSLNNPDQALLMWSNIFMNIINKHAPVRCKRVSQKHQNPWFNIEINREIHKRDWLLKHGLHDDFKKQRNYVKLLIRRSKKVYFSNAIKTNNSKEIWSTINLITRRAKKSQCPVTTLNADSLSAHFSSCNGICENIDVTNVDEAANLTQIICGEKLGSFVCKSIPFMTIFDLSNYFRVCNHSNTSSVDNISNYMLKIACPRILYSLTYIYNLCINTNYFPKYFKEAVVIPLHKKGDFGDPKNYRPISILSSLSKPLEKHIFNYLNNHLTNYSLLHVNQSGFRFKHSCETALIKINEMWLDNINNNRLNGSIFVDFKQAFDTIDHRILLKKLSFYGFDCSTLKLLESFLFNRTQVVKYADIISKPSKILRGVPQGSILGPVLFSIYVNDLPSCFSNAQCELFADDTSIHVSSESFSHIQSLLQLSADELNSWVILNKMYIHPEKTNYMLITTRQKHQNLPGDCFFLHIANSIIGRVKSLRFLGVTVDESLSWNLHIQETSSKIAKYTYLLAKIKRFVDSNVKRTFYYAFIHSRINYAILVYGGAAKCHLKHLISIQKRAVKLISANSLDKNFKYFLHFNILPFESLLNYNKCVFFL